MVRLVLAIGATGALDPALGLGVPGLGLTVALPVALLAGAFFSLSPIRDAMLAIPLPALVAVNAIRVLGVIFVILHAAGELPAPFAPSAGWGDIFVGVTALPVAWSMLRFGARARPLALLWNTIGIADLINAVALGALSAPGPIQVFAGPPSSAAMTTLPWLMIPGFLVPCLMFIHIVIFYRLAKEARGVRDAAARRRDGEGPRRGLIRASAGPTRKATPRLSPGVADRLPIVWRRRRRAFPPKSARRRPSLRRAIRSRLGERNGHESAVAVGGLDPHQHRLLALALRVRDLGLHLLRRRHRLAGDVEDDLARAQALLSGCAVRIDADDGDALVAGAGDFACGRELDAERRGGLVSRRLALADAVFSSFCGASVASAVFSAPSRI